MARQLNASPHVVATETYHEDSFTTKQLVAAGKRNCYRFTFYNPTNAIVFVKFYDAAATGDVTVGTTVPKFTVPVPSLGIANEHGDVPMHKFANGIVIAPTTEQADSGTTAPSSGLLGDVRYR